MTVVKAGKEVEEVPGNRAWAHGWAFTGVPGDGTWKTCKAVMMKRRQKDHAARRSKVT